MDDPQHPQAFQAPSVEELAPLFPAYDISGFIAQGGMGAVYSAQQKSLDRPVAIKILPREFGSDAQFRASFEAEAKAMARLNHPNLISVYDFGDIGGMLFIVMEFVEAKSIHDSAHGIAIEQKEVANVVIGICRGLGHAHQAGILHRDIKPANILLTSSAQAKIGDFGLARPVSDEHNPEEIIFGTPGYTAPEVINHPHAVDERTDIYAVGVILYELLTGQLPTDPWQPPSALAKTNPGFDAIVRRATHPSPELRYSDANELADDLEALTKKLDGAVLRKTTLVTSGAATRPATTTASIARPALSSALSSAKKSSFPVWAVVLLLGAFTGVFGFIALTGDEPARPKPPVVDTPAPKPEPKVKPKPKPVVDNNKPKKPKPEPEPEPEPVHVESPTEALARLQPNLKKGDLSEFPKGTVKHGEAHYFLVPNPLNWADAARFAEFHGGQLAILATPADLEWAADKFKSDNPTWLGLSDSGTEQAWFWVDGTKPDEALWAPNQPDDTPGTEDGEDFAALLPAGVHQLDDLPADRRLPFLIQWSAKGENNGTFAKQLGRTAEALKARRGPVFPAGSRNIDGSRFLLIARSGTWNEAAAMATAAGGHLAVPSSDAEAAWISSSLRSTLGPGQSCWIGGRKSSSAPRWTYVTGERFEFIVWAAEEPGDGTCLQIQRDGPHAAPPEDTARYLLIEWSAPSRRNMPDENELALPARADEWLAAFRKGVYEENKIGYERFIRRWDRNVENFIDDMQSEVDTARRREFKALDNAVKAIVKTVENQGAVPEEIPKTTPGALRDIHTEALEKQGKIWEDYEGTFDGIYNKYLEDNLVQAANLITNGDTEGADLITREHAATKEDDNRMHQILQGQSPAVPAAAAGEEEDE